MISEEVKPYLIDPPTFLKFNREEWSLPNVAIDKKTMDALYGKTKTGSRW